MKNQIKYFPLIIIASLGLALGFLILTMKGPSATTEIEAEEHSENGHSEKENEGHPDHGNHGSEESAWESVALHDSTLAQSGATLEVVQIRSMAVRLPLLGEIVLNEDRTARIHPRFPGIIQQVKKQLGSKVRRGDVLAVIESNESLQSYNVVSQMDGVVVSRNAAAGESVDGDDELFVIADLSTVWVDFQVYRQDFNRLRLGQGMRVIAEGIPPTETSLAYLSPSVESHSQSLLARVVIPNTRGVWTPGLFVRGEAAVEEFKASAIRLEAVQQFPDGPVVFVRENGHEAGVGRYLAHRVELGRRDGAFVELLGHPLPGEPYVSKNSFLLKAEIGKSEASHDH